jgi:hypothetical protein
MAARLGPLLTSLALAGCPGDDPDSGSEPDFPEDYEASYTEVRDCRGSGDHDLNNIRILVDAAARTPYEDRMAAFPEDAIVLKAEYDFGDTTCSGDIKQWTVMRKLAVDSSPDTLDWAWQQVDADRRVIDEDGARCINCHTGCGVAPDGYDWTCSIP